MNRSVAGTFIVAAIAAHSTANAKQFVMSLQGQPSQKSWVDKGDETIDTFGQKTAVRFFEVSGLLKKRGQVMVFAANGGDTSFTFAPQNVSAQLEDGTTVPVIPYAQLLVEADKARKKRAFAAAMGVFGNSLSAASAGNTYGSFNGTAYGAGGTVNAHGTYSGYDATAAAISQQNAQRQNQQLIANKEAQNAAAQRELGYVYQISTVEPGIKGGLITIELPKKLRSSKVPVPVIFTVVAGTETHEIHATFTPVK
jgi:hypothetical protein